MKNIFTARTLWILAAALFLGSLLWSILFETLLPLVDAGDWQGLIANLAGIPLVLAGTGAIVWGAILVASRSIMVMGSQRYADVDEVHRLGLRGESRRQAQRAYYRTLLAAWKPGSLWLLGGLALIFFGGWLTR